jgi:hypothetical protein
VICHEAVAEIAMLLAVAQEDTTGQAHVPAAAAVLRVWDRVAVAVAVAVAADN